MWDMAHSYVGHGSYICGTCLIHMWDMTHSYVGIDSFVCVQHWVVHVHQQATKQSHIVYGTWLIHMWNMPHILCGKHLNHLGHLYVGHDSFEYLQRWHRAASVRKQAPKQALKPWDIIGRTWLIHMWDMPHIKCATWLNHVREIHTWDMTHFCVCSVDIEHRTYVNKHLNHVIYHMWDAIHSYATHASYIRGTWLIHIWGITPQYVGHDSFKCGTWLICLIASLT